MKDYLASANRIQFTASKTTRHSGEIHPGAGKRRQ